MTMESGAENQQSGDAAVSEAENQQMTVQAQPQIATLAQVSINLGQFAVLHYPQSGEKATRRAVA